MDSTFKCNENELQVTSLGISDAQRHFHLLSISVVSHHTQVVYCQLISSLQELVSKLVSVSPFPFSILWPMVRLQKGKYLIIQLNLFPLLGFTRALYFFNGYVFIFLLYLGLYPLWNIFLMVRETMLGCFPGIHHLMCYFHVKHACPVKLKGKPMKGQKENLHKFWIWSKNLP
jgi:hypothetical protein